jgi:hypothetical protein
MNRGIYLILFEINKKITGIAIIPVIYSALLMITLLMYLEQF